MWIALELVDLEHSGRPEVTYHIFGRRDGSGKVPGVVELDYSGFPAENSARS